jgi:hypothetical protein
MTDLQMTWKQMTNEEEDVNDRMTNDRQIFLSELQQEIHDALRVQHPDWVEPDGDCPTCESYESRLAELLGLSSPKDTR